MKTTTMTGWLVGAAALLVMTMGMAACSSEGDDILGQDSTAQPKETAGVRVTVSAGISEGDGTTRSTVEMDGTKRVLKFTTGDRLYVRKKVSGASGVAYVAGMLTMVGEPSADGKSATFTGDVAAYNNRGEEVSYNLGDDPLAGTTATLVHEGMVERMNYLITLTDGTMNLIQQYAANVEELMTKGLTVKGSYTIGSGYSLAAGKPIIYCSLSGLEGDKNYQVRLQKPVSGGISPKGQGVFTTDASGAGTVAIEATGSGVNEWEIEIKQDNTTVGIISLGNRELAAKVYNVTRNWTGTAFVAPQTINLSSVSGDVTLRNGDELKGELSGYHKISIAPGATVTLSGAWIPGRTTNDKNTLWAGITCLGDATIVLADGTENYAKGYYCEYPGIQAGPAGTTLTIRGTGKLTAETGLWTKGSTTEGSAAGIGGGYNQTVGNIRIEGGNVTATGYSGGAGIGSGYYASCGDITITGGNITATGGKWAAGIGSGRNSGGSNSCGNITIGGSATGTAKGGYGSPNDIGAGNGGTCGTVSVAAGTISYTYYTVACTLKVTIIEDNGVIVSNKTCTNITISDGTRSVELSGDDVRFDNLTKVATLNFSLRGPQTGATLTVTGTGGSLQSDTYSATISGVNIVDNGATIDLGEVNLVKQQ